ncbi:MAG: hypothetical protein QOE55_6390, partial [Acidobacteriaceae bacterium]|nr:hypothetical protein [Acidobacteriaceae bacterium]
MISLQYLCAALADDDAGRHGVTGGDVRHDRAVRNAQSVHAVDAKIPIHDRQVVPAHLGRAGMMPERHSGVAYERFQFDIADRPRTGLTLGQGAECGAVAHL